MSSLATATQSCFNLLLLHIANVPLRPGIAATPARNAISTVCCKALLPLKLLPLFCIGPTVQNVFQVKISSVYMQVHLLQNLILAIFLFTVYSTRMLMILMYLSCCHEQDSALLLST